MYLYGTQVYYDLGDGEVVPEQFVLSLDDYVAEQSGRAAVLQRQAQRKLSWLQDLPPNLVAASRGGF